MQIEYQHDTQSYRYEQLVYFVVSADVDSLRRLSSCCCFVVCLLFLYIATVALSDSCLFLLRVIDTGVIVGLSDIRTLTCKVDRLLPLQKLYITLVAD